MATGDFDLYYSDSPWDGIVTNQRQWYDPMLRDLYVRKAVYNRFVTTQFSTLGRPSTAPMVITSLIPPHANTNALGSRQLWLPSSYVDTQDRTIAISRYGGKMSYHKHDDYITYWKKDGVRGLKRIVNGGLGSMLVEELDLHARNAFLLGSLTQGGYSIIGNGGTDFSDVVNDSHQISTELIDDIHLGMRDRDVPFFSVENPDLRGNILCITTPGVIRDLRYEMSTNGWGAEFLDVKRYADPGSVIRGEIGTYHGVRFIVTTRAILYNMGEQLVQSTVTSPISAGDGAPGSGTLVDGVWNVGQPSGVTNYVQLDAATIAGEMDLWESFIDQIVTVHVERTSAYGITDGVKLDDGYLHERRLIAVDKVNKRLTFDRPILEDFSTDLGAGVYAYVTKGRNIHTAMFIGGNDGVVSGVSQAPQIHTPRPVDDFDSMYRVSYDMYMGWNLWSPQVYEVAFLAGSNRLKGSRVSYPSA